MLSKTESPGVSNIETYDQRYSQGGLECKVHNISGRAMLPDSAVPVFGSHIYFQKLSLYLVIFANIDVTLYQSQCFDRQKFSQYSNKILRIKEILLLDENRFRDNLAHS